MCMFKPPKPQRQQIAATDNSDALRAADIEAKLRRRRSGAAANILTSPTGMPVTPTMGGVAQ